ncbi:MAG: PRC and DUF2382 domain-containing protein [Actinomycetota bacterium]|nr:PRC and DUF2382 domain-containing protein [Actinomycetota bacterium]
MSNPQDAGQYIGRPAIDSAGAKIGTIEQVYVNDASGQPEWVTIKTGLFGTKESFAPLQGATDNGGEVRLAVTKDVVKGAPNIDNDGHTDDQEQQALYDYYAGQLGWDSSDQPANAGAGDNDTTGTDTDGNYTTGTDTDDAMTRSEERLRVGTEQVEAGRARLRKYVVTENVTQTVPVSREEVRIEREPITDANRDQAMSGGDITEDEHEVTLRAERPVVQKETVPVERVRLGTETVTEHQEVSETVRKEQIDDVDVDGSNRTAG